ncbi:hypothetical protein CEY16_10150 [Halalkalibacillus sediminis]|uniref:Hemerythrin-like domain-containing protein n=1 Tax=Halalkalibacillus sediminis TaxID=2018042 RepID=A0A2I0QSL5_9BACI|nr:hemerythrin domain-containing protein [Halalkalibacillus sediminis]PKR77100.1 hypothetical protein CEY16_10150 [Halalkalibacillus sediminis]
MKRHEALNPLSHHHHHALVLALDMKRVGTSNEKKTYKQVLRDLINFWEQDGRNHFKDEEDILIPLYMNYAEEVEEEMIKKLLYQHAQFRSILMEIRNDTETKAELMQRLGELLDEHVRLEEREFFPIVEKTVPENYLYQANGQFHRDSYSGY